MQKKIWLWALILGAIMTAGHIAWAQSDFYVIAVGPTAVGTKITSLPYIITNAGFYYLAGNLSYSGIGDAITVNVNGVTLDLMGFRLSGPGASFRGTVGIHMSGRVNVEIRNGTVADFEYGVHEDGSTGNKHRIINVRATNDSTGIRLVGKNHLIKNCSASNNDDGLLIIGSGLIADSLANDNNLTGIWVTGPGSVLGNTAFNNAVINIQLGNSVPTSILVDRNCAFGLSPNYFIPNGTTGVVPVTPGGAITGNNAGTP